MHIPDDLLCLFSGRIERRDDGFVVDIPQDELRRGGLAEGETFRFAVFPVAAGSSDSGSSGHRAPNRTPPVSEGDVRSVEIEGLGDQGDGIARVDRGYVVIVPDTGVGDIVDIEIEAIHDNFAMARVIDGEDESGVSANEQGW